MITQTIKKTFFMPCQCPYLNNLKDDNTNFGINMEENNYSNR